MNIDKKRCLNKFYHDNIGFIWTRNLSNRPINQMFYRYERETHTPMSSVFDSWTEEVAFGDILSTGSILLPQFNVGRYFIDFANPFSKIAIEIDGPEFHRDKKKDLKREREISSLGYEFFRFHPDDILTTTDAFDDSVFSEFISNIRLQKRKNYVDIYNNLTQRKGRTWA